MTESFRTTLNNPETISRQTKRKDFPYRLYCERFFAQKFSSHKDFSYTTFSDFNDTIFLRFTLFRGYVSVTSSATVFANSNICDIISVKR